MCGFCHTNYVEIGKKAALKSIKWNIKFVVMVTLIVLWHIYKVDLFGGNKALIQIVNLFTWSVVFYSLVKNVIALINKKTRNERLFMFCGMYLEGFGGVMFSIALLIDSLRWSSLKNKFKRRKLTKKAKQGQRI